MVRRLPPTDPATRALAGMAQAAISRRRLFALGGSAAALSALSACAPPPPPTGTASELILPTDLSATEKIVNWSNWTAYLDMDDNSEYYPTLEAFIKQTGIQVNYTEDVDDNDSFFNKIAPQLRQGQSIDRDIFVFTDWMANRVINENLAQPLDLIQMPHAPNLIPSLREVSFDPGRHYSLPWQGGFGGIAYNRAKVGRDLKTIDDLWAPDLKGKVVVLSEFRDTVGLIMQSQGVDIDGDFTADQLQAAMDVVSARVADGSIRRIKGNSYIEDLKSGNAIAGICWSGDIFVLRAETEDENWKFVIPESGGTLWTDNMMIPITSTHRSNAQQVMDYYYQPEVAAEVAAWVNYVCPVQGAQEVLAKSDPDLAEDPFLFPTEDFIKEHRVQTFRALNSEEDADYAARWAKVVGN